MSSSSQNRGYTRHYEVPFLDDLHNYFPAILYEHERFSTVQDLLSYIRTQMQQRFDLFTAGQRSYGREATGVVPPPPPPAPPRPAHARPPPPVRRARPNPNSTVLPSIRATYNPLGGGSLFIPQTGAGAGLGSIADVLSAFLQLDTLSPRQVATATAQSIWDSVPVRPTREQIDAASAIEIVDSEEDMCAICQDRMPAGSEARALNACDHRFHVTCIDTWFQRDVHCPVCRHDIREEAGDAQADVPASASSSRE